MIYTFALTFFGITLPHQWILKKENTMSNPKNWRRVVGIFLAGAMMAGCFVPIAYGVAKVYEDENQVKLSINVKEKPEVVFAKAAASIEEKGIWQIAKRDDEKMVLDLKKGEQKGYLKVAKLSGEGTSVGTEESVVGTGPGHLLEAGV